MLISRASISLAAGCAEELGPTKKVLVDVSGRVRLGATPVSGGWVEFIPIDGAVGDVRAARRALPAGTILGVPNAAIMWALTGALTVFLLTRTTFGRAIYGIGNKETAAYLSGVPTQPNTFYIGFDNGGVWRSTDFGNNWEPLFDKESTGSIGASTIDLLKRERKRFRVEAVCANKSAAALAARYGVDPGRVLLTSGSLQGFVFQLACLGLDLVGNFVLRPLGRDL